VESAELNVYETHHYAEEVVLQFHQPVFASMIEGKKIMHLRDQSPFDFLPGESLMMPANEIMKIDFPEAELNNPTRCLALTISPEKIKQIVGDMNYTLPKSGHQEWHLTDANYTFTNDAAIAQIIRRLIFLFAENHESKDLFVDMMLKELMIRVVQSENRKVLKDNSAKLSNNHRIAAAIEYIRQNLTDRLNVSELSKVACMSESNFFRIFKNEMGTTPVEFINEMKIQRAASLLRDPHIQVKEVYLACGFNNVSYFIRAFKKIMHQTPAAYRRRYLESVA
jgi:AraC-like DNA-binding protein